MPSLCLFLGLSFLTCLEGYTFWHRVDLWGLYPGRLGDGVALPEKKKACLFHSAQATIFTVYYPVGPEPSAEREENNSSSLVNSCSF